MIADAAPRDAGGCWWRTGGCGRGGCGGGVEGRWRRSASAAAGCVGREGVVGADDAGY